MFSMASRAVCMTMLSGILSSCGISNIPTFDQAVNNAWHEVHDQYSKRAELVNDLLHFLQTQSISEENLVEQLQTTEDSVMQMTVSPETLTSSDEFSEFRDNQNALSIALESVMAALQRYAWFHEDEGFLSLKEELQKTENRITVARRDYIQKVDRYNSELETIPGRWWKAFMYSDSRKKENFPNSTEESTIPRARKQK